MRPLFSEGAAEREPACGLEVAADFISLAGATMATRRLLPVIPAVIERGVAFASRMLCVSILEPDAR